MINSEFQEHQYQQLSRNVCYVSILYIHLCDVHYIVTYYISVLIQIEVHIEHHKNHYPAMLINREIISLTHCSPKTKSSQNVDEYLRNTHNFSFQISSIRF